jgi:hypothetical protein
VLVDRRELHALNLREGQQVLLRSDAGEMRALVREGPCRPGHVQGFWPECNVLLARRYDPESGEPDYNTSVQIERLP